VSVISKHWKEKDEEKIIVVVQKQLEEDDLESNFDIGCLWHFFKLFPLKNWWEKPSE